MFFIYLIRHWIFERHWPIAVKLYHMIDICMCFIIQVQKFWGPSPKKIWEPKHAKFVAILRPTLITNISGTTQDIQNGKDIPPAFGERSPVNFVI